MLSRLSFTGAVVFLVSVSSFAAPKVLKAPSRAVECSLEYHAQVPLEGDPDISFQDVSAPIADSRVAANVILDGVSIEGTAGHHNGNVVLFYKLMITKKNELRMSIYNQITGEGSSFIGKTDLLTDKNLGGSVKLNARTKVQVGDVEAYEIGLNCKSIKGFTLPPEPN